MSASGQMMDCKDYKEAIAADPSESFEGGTEHAAGCESCSAYRDEMRALDVLDLEADADFAAVKKAYRVKAKAVHPDVKPGDKEAAEEFQKLQLSYEILKAAEERREWKG